MTGKEVLLALAVIVIAILSMRCWKLEGNMEKNECNEHDRNTPRTEITDIKY
jgi:hypothetical protein